MATRPIGGNTFNGRPTTRIPTSPRNLSTAPPATFPGGSGGGTNGIIPGSAADLLRQTLTEWGLQSLIPNIQLYLKQGYDSTTINLALQDTKEWKTRFAGNEIRKQKGLSVLTPAQYIAVEEQYRNILQSYGFPAGFYDKHDDFNNFIGNDISPNELQSRAQIAHDTYFSAPAEWRQMWTSYGFSHGDAIAAILDPNTATQLLNDRAQQVEIGGTAKQYGFDVSQQRAQQFQQHGTTLAQAQKAYQQIATSYGTDQNIASRFGTTFNQQQEENDLLLGNGADALKRQTLYNEERGLFEGSTGANNQSLSVSQEH